VLLGKDAECGVAELNGWSEDRVVPVLPERVGCGGQARFATASRRDG